MASLALTALIVALSIAPGDPQPGDSLFVWAVAAAPSMLQNLLHVGFYALLVISWQNTISAGRSRKHATTIAAIAILLGVILECAQLWIPGRYGSFLDIALNAAGAVGGGVINSRFVSLRGRL